MKFPTSFKDKGTPESSLGARVLFEWMITAFVAIVLVLWLCLGNVLQRSDNVYYDTLSRLHPPAANSDIVVVNIDDRSLEAIGAWPWSRSQHAALIDKLTHAGVAAIGYDVLFIEPTPEDDILARAISTAGNVYLPVAVDTPGMNGEAASLSPPPAPLDNAGFGHSMLTPDADGTIRRLALSVTVNGQLFPHLAYKVARHPEAADASTHEGITLPSDSEPQDGLYARDLRMIRFPAGISPYRSVSFIDVLRGEVPDDFLRGKRVMVGATAQGMGDRYATPVNNDGVLLPGVNIVAALVQDIRSQETIRQLPPVTSALLSLLPLLVMLVGFLTLRPVMNTVLGLLLLVLTLLVSMLMLRTGYWWPPLAACAGVIFVWPLWSWRRLAATYHYMQSALDSLKSDEEARSLSALSPVKNWTTGDEVSRQTITFSTALKQFADFNRYITQSVHSLPDAALMTDVDGVVLIANRRAKQLFDGRPLNGSHLDDLFNELGRRDWRNLIDAVPGSRDEVVLEDGRCIQIAIAALTDTLQQSTGLIVRLADVSPLRAAERERQRTLQLLGHDMRAPQVSILTLLDSEKRPANLEDQIRRNARQTLNLAEGYVQLSRAENQLLTFELINLADLVTEAADTLWPQSAAKGVELLTPDGLEEYLVEADAALMRRVIINLLDNAIRHTPTGSFVACQLSVHEDRTLLIIADQGPGLSEDMKGRLFQPFAGGNVSGSGLGLAFVHAVIQRHDGQISIEPPAGIEPPMQGACFYITLPVADAEID